MFRVLHARARTTNDRPVACITGSAGNIGRAIAERLASDGYEIVAVVYSGDGRGDETGAPVYVAPSRAQELGEENDWTVVECDLANSENCEELTSFIESEVGRLDCLVNNAATWTYSHLAETSDEDWRGVFEVNLVAPFRLVRELRAVLRNSAAGRVVNIGSSCGFLPEAGVGPYCVSKAAVHALTAWLAIELASDGILVNAVAPGFIDTTTNALYFEAADVLTRRLDTIPLARAGSVHEVAHVVSFLASPDLGFVSGVTVRCDGGFLSGAAGLPPPSKSS